MVAILAGVLVLPAVDPSAQTPTFSSHVEAVRVDVLVTAGGKPVRGLAPGDFRVFDNGVEQHVDLVSFEQVPLNVVLALDMSASVVGDRLAHLRAASLGLLDGLTREDRAAVVTFNHRVLVGSDLTADRDRVRRAIERPDPMGNTSLVDATFTALLLGDSNIGRALVIVFSDGVDTTSWLAPDSVVDAAQRGDVVVYGVSAGDPTQAAFLRQIAEQTGGRLFEIESTRELSGVFLNVLEEFRQRYLVSYSPKGVAREGWHSLAVRIKGRNVAVKARPGYLVGH